MTFNLNYIILLRLITVAWKPIHVFHIAGGFNHIEPITETIQKGVVTMTKEDSRSVIMTVDEVAEYLKLSKITVYKLTQKGEIPGFRIGSSWRYNRELIDEIARVGTKKIAWSFLYECIPDNLKYRYFQGYTHTL